MATTDPGILRTALEVASAVGMEFAVLHGLRPGEEVRSDVDIVSPWPSEKARLWGETLQRRHGVYCVQRWRYDVDGRSYFLMSKSGAGAQLDLLSGSGQGRYGLRADVALQASGDEDGYRRVSSDDSLLYQLVKRRWKGDLERLAALSAQARPRADLLAERADVLFTGRLRRYALEALEGRAGGQLPARPLAARTAWAWDRVRHPAGWWWHTDTAAESDVEAVASILGRTLVRSYVLPAPTSLADAVRTAARTRRPGAVATRGRLPPGIKPHLHATGGSARELLGSLVAAAHARMMAMP